MHVHVHMYACMISDEGYAPRLRFPRRDAHEGRRQYHTTTQGCGGRVHITTGEGHTSGHVGSFLVTLGPRDTAHRDDKRDAVEMRNEV